MRVTVPVDAQMIPRALLLFSVDKDVKRANEQMLTKWDKENVNEQNSRGFGLRDAAS